MKSTASIKSLFILYLLSGEIIARADERKLIELAEFAISIRAWQELAQIGARLQMSTDADYYNAGLLYSALALNRIRGGREQAEGLLRSLTECGSNALAARAWLALGSNHLADGDSTKAVIIYQKANQLDKTSPLTIFFTAMMTIAAHSAEGHHNQSLDSLNGISKLADYVGRFYRPYLLKYRNSVAVELNELGHVDEARKVLKPALESPYASAYSELHETDEEIARNESAGKVVSITRANGELSVEEKRDECLEIITHGSAAFIERMYPLMARP